MVSILKLVNRFKFDPVTGAYWTVTLVLPPAATEAAGGEATVNRGAPESPEMVTAPIFNTAVPVFRIV
ncbi:MAG: hypothetical protein Pars2KO_23310 [Parasphingorhabdus sp.]